MNRRTLPWQLQVLEDRSQPSAVTVAPPLTALPPTANDDFIDTDGTNPVAVPVLENDAAVSPATLNPATVQIVSGPSRGTLTIDKTTGDITYTATGFFQGSDTFKYTVKDSNGAVSNAATVTVVVNRPTANDDFTQTTGNAAVAIQVLDNDTDPDGNDEINTQSVAIVTPPTHGTAVVMTQSVTPTANNPSGLSDYISYTPNAGFIGTDTLQYTITDFPGAVSKPGTLTIVVGQSTTITAPTANDDVMDTDGTNPVTVPVTDNDAAAAGLTIDPTTVKLVTAAKRGTVTVDPVTGDMTYTATGFFQGTDSFQYTVKDSKGTTSNVATVTIIVNRPTANDDFIDTDGNNPVTIDVLANDSDPDGNDEINPASVTVVSNPGHGVTSVDPTTGKITYTSTGFFQGTDTFQYTITDFPGAVSSPATVTVIVNRPTANPDSASTTGSTPVAINVLDNDTDPDGNDEINPASVTIVTGPAHGTATVDAAGQVTYTPNGSYIGTDVFTYTITDFPGAVSSPGTVRIRVDSPSATQITAAAADAGGGPRVNVYNADGSLRASFFAYDSSFTGGVRVAVGDVNGDGVPDIITAAGTGGGPDVRIFDGVTLKSIGGFFAYDSSFRGGVNVAVADVNGDGYADIITGAGNGGGPEVKVFSGKDGSLLQNFFAYNSTFRGGVNVAAGDVNGDGRADIITGAGVGGGPQVTAFSGASGAILKNFFAYNSSFRGGVTVAAGDFNADGLADIVTGAGPGGGPHVEVFNSANGVALASFFAYDSTFTGGVRVAAGDVTGDGVADLIVAPGAGQALQTQYYNGTTFASLSSDSPFGSFNGGVFVGAAG